jgi:UDP-2,3-diacylglucosamine pyrophosphatase LpxH
MPENLHDIFLKGLRAIEGTDLFLVSRLKDERIQFPHRDEIRVFIPDLHLVSNRRGSSYKYTTNSIPVLEKLISFLVDFKAARERENQRVPVYQLGDFVDLYREGNPKWTWRDLNNWRDSLQFIMEDRAAIIFPLLNELKATFLLGNHDPILNKFDNFTGARYSDYFPNNNGPCVVMHGHLFSTFEMKMPDWLKRLGVLSSFGQSAGPSNHDIDNVAATDVPLKHMLIEDSSDSAILSNKNLALRPAEPGHLSDDEESDTGRYNVKEKGSDNIDGHDLKYLGKAKEFFVEQNNLDIRLVVLGHTHHARIAVDETDGKFFAVADCGAWTVNCTAKINNQGDKKKMPNMQLGVLSDNEMRVYHFTEPV